MRRQTSEWSVRMLADLEGRINLEAEYQRGIVWSKGQRLFLIDSILRGYDLPKIFLRKLPDGSPFLFDVIDGKQRITSIWEFLSDKIRLPRNAEFPGIPDVRGKTWSELPPAAQDIVQFARITVSELETENDEEIRDLFLRLQKGEPLNPAERRNAIPGSVRDFVADTLSRHEVWDETRIKPDRGAREEISAIVLALIIENGPTGLKSADLEELYETGEVEPTDDIATSAISLLDTLYAIARTETGALRTRWGIVDLSLSIMRMEQEGIEVLPSSVMAFFQDFEVERRQATTELADLRSTVVDLSAADSPSDLRLELPAINVDMLTYVNAFSRDGATRGNVQARAEVMISRLREYLQGIN